ncbi:conserved hypothetical protein [Ricinus communis]|uniref:Uncharacterized protein n=1 Tax=Ricinus communis TaxID=3988 RepID=B9RH45_RICCO|nr:conserved hypothetical protein [Ricinus communis]
MGVCLVTDVGDGEEELLVFWVLIGGRRKLLLGLVFLPIYSPTTVGSFKTYLVGLLVLPIASGG